MEWKKERYSVKGERDEHCCESCAVWMFSPSSAVDHDVSSFHMYPVLMCVCVC